MHATHGQVQEPEVQSQAKSHCHGGGATGHDDQDQLRRPPCKTSFTLAGSLLPPFMLAALPGTAIDLHPMTGVADERQRRRERRQTPETPPPILSL